MWRVHAGAPPPLSPSAEPAQLTSSSHPGPAGRPVLRRPHTGAQTRATVTVCSSSSSPCTLTPSSTALSCAASGLPDRLRAWLAHTNSSAAAAQTRLRRSAAASWWPWYPPGNSSGMKPVVMCPAMKRGCTIIDRRKLCGDHQLAGVLAVAAVGDELGDHRVVVHRDLASLRHAVVYPHRALAGRARRHAHGDVGRCVARILVGRTVDG
eukprot:scaffold6589_cov116-Isochrysis_galbana.AAC.4